DAAWSASSWVRKSWVVAVIPTPYASSAPTTTVGVPRLAMRSRLRYPRRGSNDGGKRMFGAGLEGTGGGRRLVPPWLAYAVAGAVTIVSACIPAYDDAANVIRD